MSCQRTPHSSPSPRGEDTSPEFAVSGAHVHLHRATGCLNTVGSSLLPLLGGWIDFTISKQCFHNFSSVGFFFLKTWKTRACEMKASSGLH